MKAIKKSAINTVLAFALSCCCLPTLAAPVQWATSAGGNGHYYEFVPASVVWTSAKTAAESRTYLGLQGHLATINSASEQSYIATNLGSSISPSHAWAGGYQDKTAPDYTEPSGGWRWVTGEAFSYTNWAPGEPNSALEEYLMFHNASNSFTWNDGSNSTYGISGYLVEYEGAPSPAPTVSLSVSAASVSKGESTTLSWSSTDATSCMASGNWSGTKGTSGSETSSALNFASTSFTLTCTGTGGTASKSVSVTVVGGIVALTPLVSASDSISGLELAPGQRKVRVAGFKDGRVAVTYSRGYPINCGLFSGCTEQGTTWHMIVDGSGIAVNPQRSWTELDSRAGLNSGTIFPSGGRAFGDGSSVIFSMSHSSHNSMGGNFLKMNSEGAILATNGGSGSYSTDACVIGTDLVLSALWVDPVSNGMQWWTGGSTLATTVNFGGYGYNYNALQNIACGTSSAMGGNYAIIVRKQPAVAVGFTLYSAPGPIWTQIGSETRLPATTARGEIMYAGGIATGDDTGVIMFRDASAADNRVNMYYARFRITASGIVLIDSTPQPVFTSAQYEGLDGTVTYGGSGIYYLTVFHGGRAASGQPTNTRQAVRAYSLDFSTGGLNLLAPAYEDGNWTTAPVLDFYGNSANVEGFSSITSCDGNLYIGGAVDNGTGRSTLKVFKVPVGPASCGGPPVITRSVSGTTGDNGWFNSDVSVSWTVDTRGFTEKSRQGCAPITVSTDNANLDVSCSVTTAAGTSTDSITIKRDATSPVAAATPSPLPNANGWNKSAVSVTFNGTDATSGVASCSSAVSVSTEGDAQASATGTCTDNAGNVSAPVSYSPVKIDLTPPVVTASRLPAANAAGWNNTPVVASFAGVDTLSGIAADGCSAPITFSNSGAGQTTSGGCTDLAGNTATATVSGINIDLTAPVASASISPAPNAAGWHKAAATIAFDGTDSMSGSGLAGCSTAATVSTDGAAQARSGTCTDLAGNTSNTASAAVNLDATAPTITLTAPASGGSYVQNSVTTANYGCTDALSGIIGCLGTVPNGSAFSTSTVGTNSFTVQATDLAGNTSSRTISYTVTAPSPFTLAPSSLAFGDRLLNSSTALAVTIRNNSAAALALTSPTLSGTDAKQFTLTRTCGTSLAAGASCTVTATFKPTGTGPKTAAFAIRVGTSTQTVPLTGNGVAVAFSVSPTSLKFANQTRNTTSASQTVTVTNSVALPITLSSITLGGTNANQYVKTQTCGTSLAANASCTVSIAFRPTSAGTKTATLTVTPSGATSKTVSITGTGL